MLKVSKPAVSLTIFVEYVSYARLRLFMFLYDDDSLSLSEGIGTRTSVDSRETQMFYLKFFFFSSSSLLSSGRCSKGSV